MKGFGSAENLVLSESEYSPLRAQTEKNLVLEYWSKGCGTCSFAEKSLVPL